jgi:AraC-like DNA-binding protein
MRNASSGGAGPAASGPLSLDTIWDVDADPSYDVRRTPLRKDRWVAVRTLAGRGILWLAGRGAGIPLEPGTLLVTRERRISRYRCGGRRWRFWWFEFMDCPRPACPLDVPFAAAARPADAAVFRAVFAALRREHPAERAAAAAGFSLLLHGWIAGQASGADAPPHGRAIRAVMDLMHDRVATGWTVAGMAAAAGMGERRFRQVFPLVAGDSPKRWFDGLRLETGRRLLGLGLYSVQEVAELVGFSSPFHFSKAYRRRFGVPPSADRGRGESLGAH